MLAVSASEKSGGALGREVIRQTWTELLEIPVNSAGGMADIAAKLEKVLSNPSAIARYIRKRRG